jgi:hypothetical protein
MTDYNVDDLFTLTNKVDYNKLMTDKKTDPQVDDFDLN